MQPKSYTVFKWAVYALATLLFFALQGLVLDHVRVWGLTPFLYPILPAVEAMYEGPRRGPVFALVMGLFCDILIWGPFEGFYALSFTIIALISAVIGENMLTPGTFCALLVSVGARPGPPPVGRAVCPAHRPPRPGGGHHLPPRPAPDPPRLSDHPQEMRGGLLGALLLFALLA